MCVCRCDSFNAPVEPERKGRFCGVQPIFVNRVRLSECCTTNTEFADKIRPNNVNIE